MKDKLIIASFRNTIRVAPEEWERRLFQASFDSSATLKDVLDWVNENDGEVDNIRLNFKVEKIQKCKKE